MIQGTLIFPSMQVKEERHSNLIDQEITNQRLVCITKATKVVKVAEVSTGGGITIAQEIVKAAPHVVREIPIGQRPAG
jgi:hypothetical protein